MNRQSYIIVPQDNNFVLVNTKDKSNMGYYLCNSDYLYQYGSFFFYILHCFSIVPSFFQTVFFLNLFLLLLVVVHISVFHLLYKYYNHIFCCRNYINQCSIVPYHKFFRQYILLHQKQRLLSHICSKPFVIKYYDDCFYLNC